MITDKLWVGIGDNIKGAGNSPYPLLVNSQTAAKIILKSPTVSQPTSEHSAKPVVAPQGPISKAEESKWSKTKLAVSYLLGAYVWAGRGECREPTWSGTHVCQVQVQGPKILFSCR